MVWAPIDLAALYLFAEQVLLARFFLSAEFLRGLEALLVEIVARSIWFEHAPEFATHANFRAVISNPDPKLAEWILFLCREATAQDW